MPEMFACQREDQKSRDDLLEGLDSELLKQYLEKGIDGPEQDAVKAALNDVNVAKFVEIPAHHIEKSQRQQGKSVQEQDFVEAPALQLRNLGEQHQDESEAEDRGR